MFFIIYYPSPLPLEGEGWGEGLFYLRIFLPFTMLMPFCILLMR